MIFEQDKPTAQHQRSAATKGSNTQHNNRTNTTSASRPPTKHHPCTARHTHPPTKPSTHEPTHPPCSASTAANGCIVSCSNFARAGRLYSGENRILLLHQRQQQLHLPQALKHSRTHETTATHPPNQPPANRPTHPITKHSNQHVLQQSSNTAVHTSRYVLQQTEAIGPYLIFYLENTIMGTLHLQRSTITC